MARSRSVMIFSERGQTQTTHPTPSRTITPAASIALLLTKPLRTGFGLPGQLPFPAARQMWHQPQVRLSGGRDKLNLNPQASA